MSTEPFLCSAVDGEGAKLEVTTRVLGGGRVWLPLVQVGGLDEKFWLGSPVYRVYEFVLYFGLGLCQ